MTRPVFVSYAQNQEDVVLSRLLSVVPSGRFIDVGAGHPIIENVTYALYQLGWRGINVEPMAAEVALLRELRPEDETIMAAAGAKMGSVTLFEAPAENRGATTSSTELAERYGADGQPFVAFESPLVTLSSLLEKFESGAVHLIKIDVEGMEFDVLSGADLRRHRPWVLVVESTEPNTTISTSDRWEHIVLEAGYRCTLFDGLNRYYVRDDLDDIASLLSLPTNVFDHWTPSMSLDLEDAQQHAELLEREVTSQRDYISSLLAEIKVLRASVSETATYAQSLLADIDVLRASVSEATTYAQSLLETNEVMSASAIEAATYVRSLEAEIARLQAALQPNEPLQAPAGPQA